MANLTRREVLKGSVAFCSAAVLAPGLITRAAESGYEVKEIKTISMQDHLYHGWPTVTRRQNGDLLVVYSGGRQGHVCPFGRVEIMRSRDEGKTWTFPRVLIDSDLDDRDAGVMETGKGTILVTTFSSLAYAKQKRTSTDASWKAAHDRLNEKQRQAQLDNWMIRSTDGGINFSAVYRVPLNSPHGPIQASDGRLLYAGKDLWRTDNRVGVCASDDDGLNWKWLATVGAREGDDYNNYHELHMVECSSGRLLLQIRNHNKVNDRETLQCESTDGGKTWSQPHSIGVWGLPSFLLRLKDERLLMTYGHRREPLGNQARISADQGKTWSEPMIVSGDGTSGDLGYPSTVQLKDDSLLTVWYEKVKSLPLAVLRQAHWTLS